MPVARKCKQCGKVEQVPPSWAKRLFCSLACYGTWMRDTGAVAGFNHPRFEHPVRELTCACGAHFTYKPTARRERKFCSIRCSNRAIARSGSAHHNWRGGDVQLACSWCEREITRRPSKVSALNFCGKDCHLAHMRSLTIARQSDWPRSQIAVWISRS
jgi:endogenous inhibitor of DNA gyrase (YacG/DUF329 family)